MKDQPYEILLRWTDDGKFSGGHTIRRNPATGQLSTALPLGKDADFPWPAVAKEINAALRAEIATVRAAHDELTARVAALTAELENSARAFAASKAVIADQEISDEETYARLAGIIGNAELPARERALAEAELEAKKAADRVAQLRAEIR